MRVCVTGGSGFVGAAVVEDLLARNATVTCITRPESTGRLPDGVSHLVETPDVFAESAAWWRDVLATQDMVIHSAWYAEPGKYLTSPKNLSCLSGTLALAQGAAQAGVSRFVGVGTCFEYDLTGGVLSIETPLAPLTPYAAAKAAAYLSLNAFFEAEVPAFLWARLFYLYGDREDPRRLVPYLHQQLRAGERANLTSGTQVRDFMDVRAAAKLLVDDALSSRTGATNIASGNGITVRALAEQIADGYGRRDLLNFGARPDNLTDPPCVIGARDDAKGLSSASEADSNAAQT